MGAGGERVKLSFTRRGIYPAGRGSGFRLESRPQEPPRIVRKQSPQIVRTYPAGADKPQEIPQEPEQFAMPAGAAQNAAGAARHCKRYQIPCSAQNAAQSSTERNRPIQIPCNQIPQEITQTDILSCDNMTVIGYKKTLIYHAGYARIYSQGKESRTVKPD